MGVQREPGLEERQRLMRSEHQGGGIESREEVRISQQPGATGASTPADTQDAAASVEHRERFVRDAAAEHRLILNKVNQFVWLVIGIVEGLIGLRVLLKLIAANPGSPFARFIYDIAALFLSPFASLTASPSAGGMVLEVPSIIAMMFYALLGWAVVRLIRVLFEDTKARSATTFDQYRT